jgi:calcineurin-like phosphoesterase family protein
VSKIFSRKWYKHNPWLVSDTHFGHKNIVKFVSNEGRPIRPWDDVDEMTEDLISFWNEVVQPDDLIIHLGDIAFGGPEVFHKVMPRLSGNKVLVKGNHDLRTLNEYKIYFEDVVALLEIPEKAILTHIPIHPAGLMRFGKNIHGHLHGNVVLDDNGEPDPRYRCVSVEHTNWRPIRLDDVLNDI